MEYKDYYKILGVERGASKAEIKKAYHKMARKYHPDVSKEANAEAHFKEVSEAYEVLHDDKKRKAYDNLGSQWKQGQNFHRPREWEQRYEFHSGSPEDLGEFSDFFRDLFGGGSPFGGFSHREMRSRGEDQNVTIEITLGEAYHGGTHTLRMQLPGEDANGHYGLIPHTLQVKIPAGVYEGQKIRLAGQGGKGIGGGANGDLLMEVHLKPHNHFKAEGRDLYLTLPITPWEAALGTKIDVPTLDKKIEVKIPAGSQSGNKLRLKGKGLPAKAPGDLYLVLEIKTPKAENKEQQKIYEEMAKKFTFNPRGF
jgi:curved DNA-binding protein